MLVLGDAHADDPEKRRALRAAYEAAAADCALQVGDLALYDPPTPTWFVAGNNEDFEVVEALRERGSERSENRDTRAAPPRAAENRDPTLGSERPVHLLASTAAEVGGLRVAGLSGTFAPTQYDRPRSELAGDRRRHFVREDVERLLEVGDVDVLLTHQAPHGLLRIRGRDVGCDPVDRVVSALSPDLCLVGHFHRHAEADVGDSRVVALAPVWRCYYDLDPETLDLDRHATPDVG